ncbi:MAG TPA: DinB family protein [Aggregatilineales bacterium]|nr:DinB family protein [Aggregatilineales bacterium]
MSSKATFWAALAAYQRAYWNLFRILATYPAERGEQPGACGVWSPKQVLAHCSGWNVEALRRYDQYAAGDATPVRYDFDSFNAKSVEDRAYLDWQATVQEVIDTAGALYQRSRSLPDEAQLNDPRHAEWLTALAEDCHDHTEQLKAFIQ